MSQSTNTIMHKQDIISIRIDSNVERIEIYFTYHLYLLKILISNHFKYGFIFYFLFI